MFVCKPFLEKNHFFYILHFTLFAGTITFKFLIGGYLWGFFDNMVAQWLVCIFSQVLQLHVRFTGHSELSVDECL